MIDALMAQVVALRAQLEALASTVDALREAWPLPTEPTCPHTELEDRSTFGHPNLVCRRCGQTVDGPPS